MMTPLSKMNQSEIEHRDQLLRAYFAGRNWDVVGEYDLKRELVLNSAQLLPNYPFLIDDEWEYEPGHANKGLFAYPPEKAYSKLRRLSLDVIQAR